MASRAIHARLWEVSAAVVLEMGRQESGSGVFHASGRLPTSGASSRGTAQLMLICRRRQRLANRSGVNIHSFPPLQVVLFPLAQE